jgi:hypothetical protein
MSLSWCQISMDTSITMIVPSPSFVTSDDWFVSYSDQVHSLSLGYHRSLSLWFCKWLQTLILHLFCQVEDVKADPILKLVFALKIDSIWVVVDRLTKFAHFIPSTPAATFRSMLKSILPMCYACTGFRRRSFLVEGCSLSLASGNNCMRLSGLTWFIVWPITHRRMAKLRE